MWTNLYSGTLGIVGIYIYLHAFKNQKWPSHGPPREKEFDAILLRRRPMHLSSARVPTVNLELLSLDSMLAEDRLISVSLLWQLFRVLPS